MAGEAAAPVFAMLLGDHKSADNMFGVAAKPGAYQGIERHDGRLAAIAFQRPAHRQAQGPHSPVARFDFDQHRDPSGDLLQSLAQARDLSMAVSQGDPIDILGTQIANQSRSLCQTVQFIVVKDKGAAIFGGLDVAFNAVTQLDRGLECGGTVFQHAIAMQSAMRIGLAFQKRDAFRGRRRREQIVEQRRDHSGFRAMIASTSTATPSGSEATPTALRACWPEAPKITSIMSEQPLATLGWSV